MMQNIFFSDNKSPIKKEIIDLFNKFNNLEFKDQIVLGILIRNGRLSNNLFSSPCF